MEDKEIIYQFFADEIPEYPKLRRARVPVFAIKKDDGAFEAKEHLNVITFKGVEPTNSYDLNNPEDIAKLFTKINGLLVWLSIT